jgi:predicted nucleotidyltransferase
VDHTLTVDRDKLAEFCRRHAIERLSLLGSVLHGNARSDSDLDILVEFTSGKEPGLIGLAAIEADLSALFGGRPVDLRTPQDLSPHFRGEVLRTAEVQYAALMKAGPLPASLKRTSRLIAFLPIQMRRRRRLTATEGSEAAIRP